MKKKMALGTLALGSMFCFNSLVGAESGTYTSTYDFQNRLSTRQTWNASAVPTFVVNTCPNIEKTTGEEMNIFLQRLNNWGRWPSVDTAIVPAKSCESTTLQGDKSGEYRIDFQSASSGKYVGDVSINYSW